MPLTMPAVCSKLADADPLFEQVRQRLEAEWNPEVPPVTILFGCYGEAFAQRVQRQNCELSTILAVVEDLMQNGSEQVRNAVATGFWEAVLAESSGGRFDFRLI